MKRVIFVVTAILLVFSLSSCSVISDLMSIIKNDNSSNDDSQNEEHKYGHYCGVYFPEDYDPSSRIHLTGYCDIDEKRETYILLNIDEVYAAIELLKNNGSSIKESVIFDCESLGYNVIYLFNFEKSKAEKLKDGQGYFDRKIDDGVFTCRIYYNEHTIEEINDKNLSGDYGMYIYSQTYITKKNDARSIVNNIESFEVTYYAEEYGLPPYYFDSGKQEFYQIKVGEDVCIEIEARIGSEEQDSAFMPEDIHEIVKTIKIIEEYNPEQ